MPESNQISNAFYFWLLVEFGLNSRISTIFFMNFYGGSPRLPPPPTPSKTERSHNSRAATRKNISEVRMQKEADLVELYKRFIGLL